MECPSFFFMHITGVLCTACEKFELENIYLKSYCRNKDADTEDISLSECQVPDTGTLYILKDPCNIEVQ